MKYRQHLKLANIIYILTLMLLIGCSSNVIDEDDLIEKASLKYLNNNDEPYTGAISSKFENGKNKIIGQYKDGKRVGSWTFFYDSGSKKEEGNYLDGSMEGEWISYSKDGIIVSKGEFISSRKNGLWKYWYNNGKKEEEVQFVDDKRSGKSTTWFSDGKQKIASNYIAGKLDGEFLEWDQDGKKISEGYYKNTKKWSGFFGDDYYLEGKRGSLVSNFYKNGQKKAEGILIDGMKNGNWSEWYANGDKKYTGMYKDGIKDGRWIEWNQSSEEIINGFYKNNVPWRGQFENFFYSDGRIAQEYNKYFENGEKKITGTFVNNKKSGEWIEWYSNGQKKYIGNFLNGNRHGSWVAWDESGNEIIDGEYKSGQKWNGQFGGKNYVSGLLRQDFVEKYPSGALKSSGVLINEVKIGQWSFWYENQVIKESGFLPMILKMENGRVTMRVEIKNLLEVSIMAGKMVTGFNGMMIL